MILAVFLLLANGASRAVALELALPNITAIRAVGTNLHITAAVPAGYKSVVLESRGTNDLGAWKPRAVRRLKGKAARVVFRVPQSSTPQNFQVTGSPTEKLPPKFWRGKKAFRPVRSAANRVAGIFGPSTSQAGLADFAALDSGLGGNLPRQIVESDIWKISGDRLYYFNQYRGLQIINISNPDSASLLGSVNLPAAGEQMYLLGNHVVLLAGDQCHSESGGSQLVIIDVATSEPKIVAQVPVQGSILESRLVGSALYMVTRNFNFGIGGKTLSPLSSSESVALSFDLSNPASPVAKGNIVISGSPSAVFATDKFLFVAENDLQGSAGSQVDLIDISSPNGTMISGGSIAVQGTIADKFKMNLAGTVFTVISEVNDDRGGHAVLETFSVANFSTPEKLGELAIKNRNGESERLFATRFDSNRAYVVTFHQIDPLWIVDLSDARNPKISGHVEVPGYSTFIQPLGNRLVTIGQDSGNGSRVAVSLFDVSNASQPALLSKVFLGENYSWSEANWDEKAFNVLPEANLILVPFEGDTAGGYASRVQLIDLGSNSLQLRGTIDHRLQPRRATLSHNRILSVSGWEFLAVNATDRDRPVVTRDLTLAWPVERVILSGDYVLEFGANGFRFDQSGGAIRVARADEPNAFVAEWPMGDLPVIGATTQSNLLYVLQSQNSAIAFDQLWHPLPSTNSATLSVIDLTQLPNLQIVGRTKVVISNSLNGWNSKPLWVRPDLLVWESANSSWYSPILFLAQPPTVSSVTASSAIVGSGVAIPSQAGDRLLPPWFFGGSGGTALIAFDVKEAATPKFVSETTLHSEGWNPHDSAFATNGLVYASHTKFESRLKHDEETWVDRSYLDVIDYSDAANPTVRDPVNISGSLAGISHEGNVLYTISSHAGTTERRWVDALAYDGVNANLISSLPLSLHWPHPTLIAGSNIFVGVPSSDSSTGSLEAWQLSDAAKFIRAGKLTLAAPADSLASFGNLLATQTGGNIQLIDASNPVSLRLLGAPASVNCLWPNLDHADGSIERGLWVPLGEYGVLEIVGQP